MLGNTPTLGAVGEGGANSPFRRAPTTRRHPVFGSLGREGAPTTVNSTSARELKLYEKNKNFDLKNQDFFKALQEDFPNIRNTFVNTELMPKFKYKRFIIMNLNINSLAAKRDLLLVYLDRLREKNIY